MNYKLDDHVIALIPISSKQIHHEKCQIQLYNILKNPTKNYDDYLPIYLVQKILFHNP